VFHLTDKVVHAAMIASAQQVISPISYLINDDKDDNAKGKSNYLISSWHNCRFVLSQNKKVKTKLPGKSEYFLANV